MACNAPSSIGPILSIKTGSRARRCVRRDKSSFNSHFSDLSVGGTLLSQLFDHHPQVWAHPGELNIGHPKKWDWPLPSTAGSALRAFEMLSESRFALTASERGWYRKGNEQTLPINFDFDLQRRLFVLLARQSRPRANRDWINLYFTSYFYSWLDFQNRYDSKKYVLGFASIPCPLRVQHGKVPGLLP